MKWGFGAILALGLIYPERGETCSAPVCRQADFLGFEGTSGVGGQIPANTPALAWRPEVSWGGFGDQPPAFTLWVNGATVAAQASLGPDSAYFELSFSAPLPEGRLSFSGASACNMPNSEPYRAVLTVGPAAPLPTALGTLEVESQGPGDVTISTVNSSAMCFEVMRANRAAVTVNFSADAEPWASLFIYQTYVDGGRWNPTHVAPMLLNIGASWEGRGRDLVVVDCANNPAHSPALSPGTHTVYMRATLPGTDLSLQTPPVTVNLTCDNTNDAHIPDVIGDEAGPGNPADGGVPDIILAEEGGCACSHSGGAPVGWAILLGLIFGLSRRGRPGAKPLG